MLKYSEVLRTIRELIVDRAFIRPTGEGAAAVAEDAAAGSAGAVPVGTGETAVQRDACALGAVFVF